MKIRHFLAILLCGLLVACGSTRGLRSPHAGRTLVYVPGEPNFDMEALSIWRKGQPGLDLHVGIPYVSLIFLRRGDAFQARYELLIQVMDRETKAMVHQEEWSDEITTDRYERTQSYDPYLLYRRIDLPPGEYLVQLTLTDLNSNKQAVRQQLVRVVAPEPDMPYLTRIRLDVKKRGRPFEPALALHLPSDMDSLRAVVHLYNASQGGEVALYLLKFPTDTTIAAPPYWLSPGIGSLRYKGIEYDRPDTLQVTRRRLEAIGQELEIDFTLPGLSRGIYRIVVQARIHTPSSDRIISRQREVSIKGPGFPRLVTLDELVDALAYIAYERELEYIKAAPNPVEKKRRFDAFWGSLIQNRQVAANVIKRYYSRVEEANLFFTTYKEGWKTDRGMIYIVLGPPVMVEERLDEEIWYYSYDERDPLRTFVFERARPYGAFSLFVNYFLVRKPIYEQMWIRAVERWRAGAIL